MNVNAATPNASPVQAGEETSSSRNSNSRTKARRLTARLFGRGRRADLLGKAASHDTLEAAWLRVRRNAGVAGGDGVSCLVFERDASSRLARLRHDLLAGRYLPGPVRRVEIVKEDGGARPLAIPCVADRAAQTAVAMVLAPLLEPAMSAASFGYRSGLGVADAVARVVELRRESRNWVLESDVARFFETVPHRSLLQLLDARTRDSRLVELISLWLDHSGEEECGILQGSPLSPLLANLYLDDVDHILDSSEGRLVRYADDFVVLSKRRADAEAAMERAAALLGERGLTLHPTKTHISRFDEGFWFLGHYFIEKLVLRDLAHEHEAAPPVWQTDAPGERREAEALEGKPRRPIFAPITDTLSSWRRLGKAVP